MATLHDILKQEISWYAGINGRGEAMRLFKIFDDQHQTYAVNAVSDTPKKWGGIVVLARIQDDIIIIEEDNTDRPLVDKLLEQGIARHQIVLAYDNEEYPIRSNLSHIA
jgi:hypothetical protein